MPKNIACGGEGVLVDNCYDYQKKHETEALLAEKTLLARGPELCGRRHTNRASRNKDVLRMGKAAERYFDGAGGAAGGGVAPGADEAAGSGGGGV